MKVYESEIKKWRDVRPTYGAVAVTQAQLTSIAEKAKALQLQTSKQRALHNLVGTALILALLLFDIFVFSLGGTLGLFTMTLVHGFIIYSLTVFTMHEGAGHQRIILGQSGAIKAVAFALNNVSRLFFADPLQYSEVHPSHHRFLGTERDQAFTHVVMPWRIFKSFLPGAGFLAFNDYKIHSGDNWTWSKVISFILGLTYHGALISLAMRNHGWLVSCLAALVVAPWLGFSLDRLRESTEHLLVKSDDLPEARELGNNLWGYVIGGGPWGQPCHLSHHLAPGLAWYQQLRLSDHLNDIFNIEQRTTYFIAPGPLGFPRSFTKLMRENRALFQERQ